MHTLTFYTVHSCTCCHLGSKTKRQRLERMGHGGEVHTATQKQTHTVLPTGDLGFIFKDTQRLKGKGWEKCPVQW